MAGSTKSKPINMDQPLFEKVEKLEKGQVSTEGKIDQVLSVLNELLNKLNGLAQKVSSGGSTKPRSANGKNVPGIKKKFPSSSFMWFKETWYTDSDSLRALFTQEQLNALEKNMESSESEDSARKAEEVAFLWKEIIASNAEMRKTLKDMYDKKAEEFDQEMKTQLAKEESE